MTFRNPILGAGGSTLLRPAIQSPNFVHGVSGWSIFRSGDAEFNQVTIRNGVNVSSTSLYYNGTPAAGNLVASISPTAGTDTFGNPYLAGMCVYDPGNGIFAQIQSGILLFGTMNGTTPNTANAAALNVDASSGVFDILSSVDPAGGFPNRALLELIAGAPGVTAPGGAEPYLNIQDPAQQSVVSVVLSGAVTKSSVGGTPETWHTPTFSGTWSTTGTLNGNSTFRGLQYRKDAEDNVWILGGATTTGAGGSVFTLPAGYFHTTRRHLLPCYIFHAATSGVSAGFAQVTETGVVNIALSLAGVSVAAGDQVFINGKFPLGNVA